jgi:hypothetical protein
MIRVETAGRHIAALSAFFEPDCKHVLASLKKGFIKLDLIRRPHPGKIEIISIPKSFASIFISTLHP